MGIDSNGSQNCDMPPIFGIEGDVKCHELSGVKF